MWIINCFKICETVQKNICLESTCIYLCEQPMKMSSFKDLRYELKWKKTRTDFDEIIVTIFFMMICNFQQKYRKCSI